jgi:hypothetical protein
MKMTATDVLAFLRTQRLAVQASRGAGESVQAALVGIAVTDALEIVFDTLASTRKARNLRLSPRAALVIGGWMSGDERTVQYEGPTDEPTGAELDCVSRCTSPLGPTEHRERTGQDSHMYASGRRGFATATSIRSRLSSSNSPARSCPWTDHLVFPIRMSFAHV